MYDRITEVSLLYDFYGELLPNRQKEVFTLKYEDDLSLSEIATELSISRQGVHDALKNGEKALMKYEEKLGLVEKFEDSTKAIKEIDNEINRIIGECGKGTPIADDLKKIQKIIDNIDI